VLSNAAADGISASAIDAAAEVTEHALKDAVDGGATADELSGFVLASEPDAIAAASAAGGLSHGGLGAYPILAHKAIDAEANALDDAAAAGASAEEILGTTELELSVLESTDSADEISAMASAEADAIGAASGGLSEITDIANSAGPAASTLSSTTETAGPKHGAAGYAAMASVMVLAAGLMMAVALVSTRLHRTRAANNYKNAVVQGSCLTPVIAVV
jgi:hypothetical protein